MIKRSKGIDLLLNPQAKRGMEEATGKGLTAEIAEASPTAAEEEGIL